MVQREPVGDVAGALNTQKRSQILPKKLTEKKKRKKKKKKKMMMMMKEKCKK
jgi:hypothetical protein